MDLRYMEKNEFNIIKKVAEGGQKIVYFAEAKADPSLKVVVKEAKINSMASLQRIMREINFLSGLNSCYFPKNYGSNFNMSTMTMTIIEEYIEGSTLRDIMPNYQSWDEIKNYWMNLLMLWNLYGLIM
jgi:Protein kinase domain.